MRLLAIPEATLFNSSTFYCISLLYLQVPLHKRKKFSSNCPFYHSFCCAFEWGYNVKVFEVLQKEFHHSKSSPRLSPNHKKLKSKKCSIRFYSFNRNTKRQLHYDCLSVMMDPGCQTAQSYTLISFSKIRRRSGFLLLKKFNNSLHPYWESVALDR